VTSPEPGGQSALVIEYKLNGQGMRGQVPAGQFLLDYLREHHGLTGAKRSCDVEVCGACTVLVDDLPVSSCTLLAWEIDGKAVRTCEGLASGGELSALQRAFLELGGFQCGYCTPGMLMAATALLEDQPSPSPAQIKHHLAGNLCRCTGYEKIIDAILAAAANEPEGDRG
jgi:aerobic carbon-monoxide dehydrogenase small subunit